MPEAQQLNLLRAMANGDQAAFRQFYSLHHQQVYNLALGYVQDISLAEEITQDVFIKAHRSGGHFAGKSAVSTWMYRITVNTSLNAVRKQKRRRLLGFGNTFPEHLSTFDHPGVALDKKEDNQLLYKMINNLPDKQRSAFLLAFVEEMPQAKVAEIMQTTVKAVEGLLQRAKKKLRTNLIESYPGGRP